MGKWAKYIRKYQKEWEQNPAFKEWIASSRDKNGGGSKEMAYCKACDCKLRPHVQDLKVHATRRKHIENMKAKKPDAAARPIDSHFKPGQQELRDDNVAGAVLPPLQEYMQVCTELKTKLSANQSQLGILEELHHVVLDSMTKLAQALPLDSLVQYTRSLVNLLKTKHNLSFEGNPEGISQIQNHIESAGVPKNRRPGIGVAVFVLSEKHPKSILLGRRKSKMGHGLYQVPGGHLEFGESWEQAACREVQEETGLHVRNVSLCSIVDTVEPEQDYHYMTVFMRGYVDETRGSEPRNMEPDKCEGWSWWIWSEVPTPDLLFWCLRDFKMKNLNPF